MWFENYALKLVQNFGLIVVFSTNCIVLVGGGAKEEQQRLNLSGTLCRPSIRPITINELYNNALCEDE